MRILLTIPIVLGLAYVSTCASEPYDSDCANPRRLAPVNVPVDEIQCATFRSIASAPLDVRQTAGESPEPLTQLLPGIKPIRQIELREYEPEDVTPPDYARTWLASQAVQQHVPGTSREWAVTDYGWAPPGVLYEPLYFEDVNLERYGYSCGVLQPALSSARFVGNAVLLPYHLVETHPHTCASGLGYARPGDCAPYYHPRRLPIDWPGAAAEAATVAGLILLIP